VVVPIQKEIEAPIWSQSREESRTGWKYPLLIRLFWMGERSKMVLL